MKKKPYDDEINISDLIFYLWDHKNKLIIITTTFLILGLLYYNSLSQSFTSTTKIKPISTFENQKYELYNNIAKRTLALEDFLVEENFDENNVIDLRKKTKVDFSERSVIDINRDSLLNLFISKIQTVGIIEKGIIKFKLVNKDDFSKEEDYRNAVEKTAVLIIDQMAVPLINQKDKSKNIPHWKINFTVNKKKKLERFFTIPTNTS